MVAMEIGCKGTGGTGGTGGIGDSLTGRDRLCAAGQTRWNCALAICVQRDVFITPQTVTESGAWLKV